MIAPDRSLAEENRGHHELISRPVVGSSRAVENPTSRRRPNSIFPSFLLLFNLLFLFTPAKT